MSAPIYRLLFQDWADSLKLTEDQVTVSYKTYKTDDQSDMQEIIDQQLTPGKELSKNYLKLLKKILINSKKNNSK